MAPIPVKPGIYKVHAHIIGPTSLLTATEHALKHGAPVITDRLNPLPIEQEWAVEPAEPVPGAPYVIHLAYHGEAGLVVQEDKLWVNAAPRPEWAQFTFERVIGGVKILSDKGLALRAGHRGAQIQLTAPQPEFQETWTLEFIRPLGEE
ncbi:hypothetical protein J7W19_32365 [Streptomyces mobaraensis NBRC 13819 = DSM 40847]|uniref:Uncharacterized protein n=2 Tax=Streptomyces mobaraensis TaxID=35621 RepID=A0A5N5VX58_STRMB|nr:hypothetical protein [Streptomyces mobaraensis]EME96532.1 hypothetical protein H340_31053 [Streptomyces mobaraensis NBRC 13819 = DSM 40847]KAB7833109.1 hypothetical protein FRZ00_33855 [Streptomyces mobaraensis]QTT77449.1 hypothetical protein J7W19_32365 [Streptomyces mobaraensis NBRC 13819 = DSM 40847]